MPMMPLQLLIFTPAHHMLPLLSASDSRTSLDLELADELWKQQSVPCILISLLEFSYAVPTVMCEAVSVAGIRRGLIGVTG